MKSNTILIMILILSMSLFASCGKGAQEMNRVTIFEKGDRFSYNVFTNNVWVKMLVTDQEKAFDTQVYNVTFEPAARTHWHSHPGGQILLVTHGTGYYQEKGKKAQILKEGDVVQIHANIVHWHGAAPDSSFVHLGMSAQVHLGPAKWLGPVTNQEYSEATAK